MAVADVRELRSDLMVGECPRWHDGRLVVSDMYGEEVVAIGLDGSRETVVAVPGRPSGTGFLPNGDLLVVSMEEAAVLRFDGTSLTRVAAAEASPLLNELVVADGRAYAGGMPDIAALLAGREHPGAGLVMPTENLYLLEDGSLRVVADGIDFPNGLVIAADGGTLVVAETLGRRLTAFDVQADGSLANRRVWAELDFMADGICLDAEGCIWVAAPEPADRRGFWRVAEGGEIMDRVPTERHAVAVMLGGPARDHLFMLDAAVLNVLEPDTMRVPGNGRVLVGRADVPGAGLP
jgi:sugar lactone lactonase YvrE